MHHYSGDHHYGYGSVAPAYGYNNCFALIVGLFILLINVGSAFFRC